MVTAGLGVSPVVLSRGAAPAVSGPIGSAGTRSDGTPEAVSATTLSGTNMNEVQEDNLPTQQTLTTNDNPAIGQISKDDLRANGNVETSSAWTISPTAVNTQTENGNPSLSTS